jgi:hypothetical protein
LFGSDAGLQTAYCAECVIGVFHLQLVPPVG